MFKYMAISSFLFSCSLKFVFKTSLLFWYFLPLLCIHCSEVKTYIEGSFHKSGIYDVYGCIGINRVFSSNLSCYVLGSCFEGVLHKWWPAGVWASDLYTAGAALWWCYQQEWCSRGQQLGLSIPRICSWSLDHQSQTKGRRSDQNLSCLAEVSIFLLDHKVILLGYICPLWCRPVCFSHWSCRTLNRECSFFLCISGFFC